MSTSNRILSPGARPGLERFKLEAAADLGMKPEELKTGDPTSIKNCFVGGQMVKRMIEAYEKTLEKQ
ncbi:MAG: alpha/beta-type small acid-soluble spore protein [Bacillota bacterium]|nr:alpha/beta-type small acid-soluble spore protein [Bacillota bacterium]